MDTPFAERRARLAELLAGASTEPGAGVHLTPVTESRRVA